MPDDNSYMCAYCLRLYVIPSLARHCERHHEEQDSVPHREG